jgi:hypothetical protein
MDDMSEQSQCPCGGKIEPVDKDWAKCDKCGDDTFPISEEAAGMLPFEGTVNGEPCTGIMLATHAKRCGFLKDDNGNS